MHILIVEDERTIAENLYDFLEARGHLCDFAHSMAAARLLCAQGRFDVIVLDRNLPDGDGVQLARQLRAAGDATSILMLTARESLDDKVEGFEAGADDYLAKPFALKEVEMRLLALHRRAQPRPVPADLRFGDLRLASAARALYVGERPQSLPPKSLRLLEVLMQQPQRVFSRQELEVAIWGEAQASSDNLRSLLHTVRKTLAGRSAVGIRNVHGLGYQLVHAA